MKHIADHAAALADANYLRRIAERMERGVDPTVARLDAAGLRAIADGVDERARPPSAREIEGARLRAAGPVRRFMIRWGLRSIR